MELPVGTELVQIAEGTDLWLFQDQVTPNVGLSTDAKADDMRARNFEELPKGAWDPTARVSDMDIDGVSMQAPFPSFPGFAGNKFVRTTDKTLAAACVRPYNDFLIEEWCAAAPDRYTPVILLPLWDPPACAAEVRRMAARGAKAVTFPDNPSVLG